MTVVLEWRYWRFLPLPLVAGLGRDERTKVGERGETGEGFADVAGPSPASQALRDLSREERARFWS